MDPVALLVATTLVAVAAAVQGALGFGFSLVAAPALALLDPLLVPGPVLVLLLVLTVGTCLRERAWVDRTGAAWVITGRLPGTLLGVVGLALLPASVLALGFAATILAGAALAGLGMVVSRRPATLVATGTLAGLMETTASIGGPPVALAYRTAAPAVARSTMSLIFVVGASLSLAGLGVAGRFGVAEATSAALLVPGVAVGLVVSSPLRRHVDAAVLGRAVLAFAVVSAVVVARQAVW